MVYLDFRGLAEDQPFWPPLEGRPNFLKKPLAIIGKV
jgi:hypothetical protein